MAYTTIDKPSENFTPFLWTGDGTSPKSFTGVGLQADMLWSKIRTDVHQNNIVDTVRGVDQRLLMPDSTNAEDTTCTHGHFDSLDSDGFTITGASGYWNVNTNTENYVGWFWKGGGTASSNTDGDITSNVSVNTTAGFSIGKFTGTGSTSTVGTGLTGTQMVILKNRDTASTNWVVYHNLVDGSYDFAYLNLTNASSNSALSHTLGSTFKVGTNSDTNATGDEYVFYAFKSIKGYSRLGTYIGNNSTDGSFIHTGFKPAFVMIKVAVGNTGGWDMYDSARALDNATVERLQANANAAETTNDAIDLLSNGFKIRNTTGNQNGSGNTHIYLAIAENPFVTSSGLPTTAR